MASQSDRKPSTQYVKALIALAEKHNLKSLEVDGIKFERAFKPQAVPNAKTAEKPDEPLNSIESMDARISGDLMKFYRGTA